MKLRLRYYGMIAQRLGCTQETLEWEGEGELDIRPWLLSIHPELAAMTWKVAVDLELVEGPCAVHESSEIVILPPFAGG
ncbi:MAG: hypothetical protein U0176_25475 [Bacteroidia bacterium]